MTESTSSKRRSSRRSASAKKETAAAAPSKEEQKLTDAAQQAETEASDVPPVDPAVAEGSTDANIANVDDADKDAQEPEANAGGDVEQPPSQNTKGDDGDGDDESSESADGFTMPEGLGTVAEGVINTVRTYAEKMAKGVPITVTIGTQQKVLIYRAFQRMLGLEGKELYTTISSVLAIINEERASAFHEKRVYRFIDQVKLSTQDRKCFERLMNMFIMVCDPSSRKQALKQVDVELTAATLRNSEKEQKLIAFFSS